MNEGFMLASKVLKRQITLEEGLVSAIARDQVANFANSFNAILGRNVLSRYQCEAMVSSRSFPTLDQLVEASEAEAATEQPELDLEPLFPQSEPPAAQTPPQGADVEPPAAASEGEEVPSCPPADPDAAPSAEPRPMLDLHALETLLKPRLEEIEDLRAERQEVLHSIGRLEWFASTRKHEESLPPGMLSFGFLFVFVIVCVVFFMQDRPVLAMAVLVPVVLLTGFMFYYEISSARERAREEQRQNEKRRRDLEHKRRQLTDLDQRIEAKLREVDAIKAHLKVGP